MAHDASIARGRHAFNMTSSIEVHRPTRMHPSYSRSRNEWNSRVRCWTLLQPVFHPLLIYCSKSNKLEFFSFFQHYTFSKPAVLSFLVATLGCFKTPYWRKLYYCYICNITRNSAARHSKKVLVIWLQILLNIANVTC